MMLFIGVLGVALLFAFVYTMVLLFSPRCPHCRGRLRYMGEDESGREVWKCRKCGRSVLV